MGIRDRLAQLTKVFGNAVPPAIEAGEAAAQMTPASPFSPGEPIGPYDGYSRTPRSRDFVTGYNISARPRSHERVAFDTLKGLVEAYDVAQMCIWHRIDSIRALDWSLVPARGYSGDADEAIGIGMAALEKPDRQTPFSAWLAKYLYDVLAYDAGTLYRLRNRRGDAIGLRVVDGTTIAPLLDYWGGSPEPPAPSHVQYVQGLPWNWLTRSDLIYEPFRPRSNSPYGVAPLETILLNANTDLRFQAYFLQRFTEGNIPEAFASAPETWTPAQIESFQGYWDQFMLGDQAVKHQIKWIPGGGKIEWSNEKDFSDAFSLFLMRKTCASYHVVPADLGFTESVNRSSGETQADVQHRVGDLPLIGHVQGVLTSFLRHDLGLPVEFAFDTGQEKEDRLALAQAWQIYIESGMASPDEGREQLLGLPGDPRRPTPRFFSTARLGPVPLLSIDGVAGKVDPETFGPAEDQPILYQPFVPPPGVVPAAGTTDATASQQAEDTYQTQVREQLQAQAGEVAKDGAAPAGGGPTNGITTATGITSYDLAERGDDEDDDQGDDEQQAQAAKSELAAFRRFAKARRREGRWRDFEFRHLNSRQARRFNQSGRLAVRKDAGEIAVAGLAVLAADTGRVLMLQRALDPEDPAAGCWEFPGGHLEYGESPLAAAVREWSEETGMVLPYAPDTAAALALGNAGTWTSGIYQGFVYQVPSENALDLTARGQISNPDDPDGDQIETLAWWDPDQLTGNPALRPELTAALPDVVAVLGVPTTGNEAVCPCGTPAVHDQLDGWQHADGAIGHDDGQSVSDKMRTVAKAATGPKGDAPAPGARWPGWHKDLECARHWADVLTAQLGNALSQHRARQLAAQFAAEHRQDTDEAELTTAAIVWLAERLDQTGTVAAVLAGLQADAHLIGTVAATAVLDGHRPRWDGWTPGDPHQSRARLAELEAAETLEEADDDLPKRAQGIAQSRLRDMARALAKGTLAGLSAAALGAALGEALTNAAKALAAAVTEVTRGSSHAALAVYRTSGQTSVQWVTEADARVCPTCDANAAAGPVPVGQPFPSGDLYPPAHPNCRCSPLPA